MQIFPKLKSVAPKPKCTYTTSRLPPFPDNHEKFESESNKIPFSAVHRLKFVHCLDILLPTNPSTLSHLESILSTNPVSYARITMKLSDIISEPFFSAYIKNGNVTMFSRGSDSTYSLLNGLLTLEVDKSTYQRLGLEGVPIGGHIPLRYFISLNLAEASGKQLARIEYAFNNVLTDSVSWVFYNSSRESGGVDGPIQAFVPRSTNLLPERSDLGEVHLPISEEPGEVLEQIHLLFAGSRAVKVGKEIDPYLCRYRAQGEVRMLTRLRWVGFFTGEFLGFVMRTLVGVEREFWAVGTVGFEGEGVTVLGRGREVGCWVWGE
ncbi:hypothetical protein K470DRAFT_275078 [Piedraia hortae CBS 480.64]|uniref:Uncharacterized protein n=1 Tax=Piedraia hortae CBS 480.64 TaxID=1314780 RepID=A0A6A7C5R6_9PEZI|nr:hypothetical protein K470DRAFT_275078 [Piedraia hortae CBS 480.64]